MDTFYAYGIERAGIETAMRFHAVKRWHMIDTTRQQTLAEHSANVALLAYYLAMSSPLMWFGPATVVATLALIHDLAEAFTGDIPTHTKRLVEGVDQLEGRVLPSMFQLEAPRNIRMLIKICDLVDGIRFIRLHGVDVTSRHAQEGLEAQLAEKFKDAEEEWPAEVVLHVRTNAKFYAYEFS